MSLHLDIVTPEKKVFSETVSYVYLPSTDGEIGVLPVHAGLVTTLSAGELRYERDGAVVSLAIGSGVAEISTTKVVVLTDMALGEADIDSSVMEAAIARAQEKLKSVEHSLDAEEVAYLQGIIAKSTVALGIKHRSSNH